MQASPEVSLTHTLSAMLARSTVLFSESQCDAKLYLKNIQVPRACVWGGLEFREGGVS